MFTSPGEIAFTIGNVAVYYYGIIMACSILFGILTAYFICKKFYKEINPEEIFSVALPIIIFAIIGARIYYCMLCFGYYSTHLLEVLDFRQGGLTIHGGILGGLLGGFIYSKRHNLSFLKICDIFSFGLCFGQAIGRWGNFFNSEAFGLPTQDFLKLYIPIYKRALMYMNFEYFQPTFLYESILDILIFLILLFIVRKYAKDNGIIFFSYLILYSIVRFFIEQMRIDSVLNLCGFPIAQVVSILIIIISLFSILILRKLKA